MNIKEFNIDKDFKYKAIEWARKFDCFSFLNFSEVKYPYGNFPCLLAAGSRRKIKGEDFEALKKEAGNQWLFGYLSYDLKNKIEKLESKNEDKINAPELFFFEPEYLLLFETGKLRLHSEKDPDEIFNQINSHNPTLNVSEEKIKLRQKVNKEEYFKTVEKIKSNLVEGDIYELNYCIEFSSEGCNLQPEQTFLKLNEISPMPFSVFSKFENIFLLSASPERFLKKEKNKLLSQPIKGTSKRGKDESEDKALKENLRNSEKEKSENMMIVDLMRNDLAKSSVPGSVKVDELFGVYSFNTVHQMISTVSSEIKKDIHPVEIIKNAFPMGSMTGAPKIRAMQLIEDYEKSKRGIFSGAAGYFTPDGDFDFNVVIRSIVYNSSTKNLSFQVGSAITYDSDPEKEYEECLLKAEAIRKVLENYEC